MFPTEPKLSLCIPTKEAGKELFNKFMRELDKTTGVFKYIVQISEIYGIMIGCSFGTIFISLFYIYLLKCITKPLLYTSMLLILIFFVLCGAWCW